MVTAAIESAAIALAAVLIFGWSIPIALMCGVVLAAISPAVTVPVMLDLQTRGLGTKKGIPTLALASATLDNIFCITAFSVIATIAFSTEPLTEVIGVTLAQLVAGLLIGTALGWILWWFPVPDDNNSSVCRTLLLASIPSALVLGASTLHYLSGGIVATILTTFVASIRWKTDNDDKIFYETKAFALLWNLFFMPMLFALIGMKLDFSMMTWPTVLTGCALIGIGAVFRFFSGIFFTCYSDFTLKEQLLLATSLLPKATVQAALAPAIVMYAAGMTKYDNEAHMAQTACIVTILLTAPLFQFILTTTAPVLLEKNGVDDVRDDPPEDMEMASGGAKLDRTSNEPVNPSKGSRSRSSSEKLEGDSEGKTALLAPDNMESPSERATAPIALENEKNFNEGVTSQKLCEIVETVHEGAKSAPEERESSNEGPSASNLTGDAN